MSTPSWFDLASQFPAEMPDTAYDAQRMRYFDAYVRPAVSARKGDVEQARTEFFSQTERPDRSNFPRTKLAAVSALSSLARPAIGALEMFGGGQATPGSSMASLKAKLTGLEQSSALDAARQGISATPYQMLGVMVGEAPYWASGFGAAGAAARALRAPQLAASLAAGGAIQGTLDALKAQEGHRLLAGVEGAAIGAGFMGVLSGVGSLASRLRAKRGVPPPVADAIEQSARGTADEATEQLATAAMQANPAIAEEIKAGALESLQAAKRVGIPAADPAAEPNQLIRMRVKGADGKQYTVGGPKGMKLADVDKILTNLDKHLTRGGELLEVRGDPRDLHQLFQKLEKLALDRGEFNYPIALRGPNAAEFANKADYPTFVSKPEDLLPEEVVPKPPESATPAVSAPTETPIPLKAEEAPGPSSAISQVVEEPPAAKVPQQRTFAGKAATDPPTLETVPAQKLIDELKAIILDPAIPEAQKSGARARLGALSPKALAETEAPIPKAPEVPTPKFADEGYRSEIPERVEEDPEYLRVMADVRAEEARRKIAKPEAAPKLTKADIADLDWLTVRDDGRVIDRSDPKVPVVHRSISDALAAKGLLAYGAEDPTGGSRRGFLKNVLGAMGAAPAAKLEALGKAVEGGRADLLSVIQEAISAAIASRPMTAKPLEPMKLLGVKNGLALLRGATSKKLFPLTLDRLDSLRYVSDFSMAYSHVPDFMNRIMRQAIGSKDPEILKAVAGHIADMTVLAPEGLNLADVAKIAPRLAAKLQKIEDLRALSLGNKWAEHSVMQRLWKAQQTVELQGARSVVPADIRAKLVDIDRFYPDMEGTVGSIDLGKYERQLVAHKAEAEQLLQDVEPWLGKAAEAGQAFKLKRMAAKDEERRVVQNFRDKKRAQAKWESLTPEQKARQFKKWNKQARAGTVTPGMELQKTGLFEMGPEGPGQFQRLYKMRYGVEDPTGRTPLPLADNAGMLMRYGGNQRDAILKMLSQDPRVLDRPLATYRKGPIPDAPPFAMGATGGTMPGVKPQIYVRQPSRNVLYHEGLHSGFNYLDINVNEHLGQDAFARKLANAFSPEVRGVYEGQEFIPEEVYVYLAQSYRTRNAKLLDAFAEADGSKEQVAQWFSEKTDGLLREVASRADSLHKRVLERRLKAAQREATGSLKVLARELKTSGKELDLEDGKWVMRHPDGSVTTYETREGLNDMLAKEAEPLTSPELVDLTSLPPGVPRYAAEMPGHSLSDAPLTSGPIPPDLAKAPTTLPEGGRVHAGASLGSYFFRPFYAWLDTVAQKNKWPELYNTFKQLDEQVMHVDSFLRSWEKKLLPMLKVSPDRRSDLYKYLETSTEKKPEVAKMLKLTEAEKQTVETLRTEFFDPLFNEFGINAEHYIQDYAPRLRQANFDVDKLAPGGRLTPAHVDFFAEHIRTGELDPRDTDLLRVAHTYLRLGARKKLLGDALEQAAALNDLKTPTGEFVTGALQPLLKRHIAYIRGIPDYTQKVVDSTVREIAGSINNGIKSLNQKLPKALQLEEISTEPRDALGKWILYSYAGALGLRPMVPIRDSMQIFLTTYAVLGGKYLSKGIARAFPAVKEKVKGVVTADNPYVIADRYGALMRPTELSNLYAGEYGSMDKSKLANMAERMLTPLRWSNNSNRLVSFFGHAEKAKDAMVTAAGDSAKFVKESGLWFLDKGLSQKFAAEYAAKGVDEDLAYRIAKELVDVSQWNYRRGAHPGIYKYAVGRLFGQYGTWPLNYIEFARRITRQAPGYERSKALTRLVLAHGAVLSVGEAFGVDTGTWVFTQPAAYGGGPLFGAVVNVPQSLDFETYKGSEARRDLVRPFWPMSIPGGLAAERIYKAVADNDPETWKIVLGFNPIDSKEEVKGWHYLTPP